MAADFLASCRRHVADDGVVLVQRQAPERFAAVQPHVDRDGTTGDEREVVFASMAGDLLTVHEVFRLDGREWRHRFTNRRIDDDELVAMLAAASLRLDRLLAPTWWVARPNRRPTGQR